MIPGSNLLSMALGVIAAQSVTYFRNTGRDSNRVGVYVASYAEPETLRGSFQPMPRNLYEQMGLSFQKSYWNFYVSSDALDVTRNVSGDYLVFNGRKYQCESITPWRGVDGWNALLCVDVGVGDVSTAFNNGFRQASFS